MFKFDSDPLSLFNRVPESSQFTECTECQQKTGEIQAKSVLPNFSVNDKFGYFLCKPSLFLATLLLCSITFGYFLSEFGYFAELF